MGQVGLAILSIVLSVLVLWGVHRLTRRLKWPLRLLVAMFTVWLFVWWSPQIYYAYYLLIFDGLPLQIVVKSPPTPLQVIRLLTFSEHASLSAHGIGALGWGCIGVALIQKSMRRRSAAN